METETERTEVTETETVQRPDETTQTETERTEERERTDDTGGEADDDG